MVGRFAPASSEALASLVWGVVSGEKHESEPRTANGSVRVRSEFARRGSGAVGEEAVESATTHHSPLPTPSPPKEAPWDT